jgi:hypothetical protein
MSDVQIIEVDEATHARTDMRPGTRMVAVQVPTDRSVTVQAEVNAKLLQRMQLWDGAGRMPFEWQGRGQGRTIGSGSLTFDSGPALIGCMSFQGERWIVNDLNVCAEHDDDERRVVIKCEDGGGVPLDWNDLVVTLRWRNGDAR